MLDEIRWSDPLLREVPIPKDLATDAKRFIKRIPRFVTITAPSPWATRMLLIPEGQTGRAYLTQREVDIISLVTAQENACRFCYGMQRASMRVAGYSEREISQIERNVDLGDEHTRALVDFCRKLAQSNPRPAKAEREGLERFGFTREHVRELAFEIAFGCLFHRFTTFFAAPPLVGLERASDKWWSILLRPVFLVLMHRKRVASVDDSGEGPWGPLIAALNGTAAPPILRRMMEEFVAPSAIPLRTKFLMMAVIARALGCPFCENRMREMLSAEGFSPEETEEALDTLQSPKLTPLEAKLMPFARATVRYEPYRIQERTAKLLEELGTEKALEVVIITSMANMLVRLAMLLAP